MPEFRGQCACHGEDFPETRAKVAVHLRECFVLLFDLVKALALVLEGHNLLALAELLLQELLSLVVLLRCGLVRGGQRFGEGRPVLILSRVGV